MLRFTCVERKKIVTHNIWLMQYSPENMRNLWEACKKHRILFIDDVNGDMDKFLKVFFSTDMNDNIVPHGLVYIMDDFKGMLFISDIMGKECSFHFSFFDGYLRFDVSKQMIDWVFKEYGFERINTQIVSFANKKVFEFVENLGFVKEGVKRKALLYKEKKWELLLYGLVREEFEARFSENKELVTAEA